MFVLLIFFFLVEEEGTNFSQVCFLALERFSFQCRKLKGFASATQHDWLKNLPPLFHPVRSKTKTTRDSLIHVLPRFESATCNYFEF